MNTGNQICAAGNKNIIVENNNKNIVADSCNGDSGGGLTATNTRGKQVILGIVSFGEPDCGRFGGKPGVYTNVADHIDWIEKMIKDEDDNITDVQPEQPQGPQVGLRCRTSNGKFCKFPFKFQGKVFASCTTDFDPDKRAWCSTKGRRRKSKNVFKMIFQLTVAVCMCQVRESLATVLSLVRPTSSPLHLLPSLVQPPGHHGLPAVPPVAKVLIWRVMFLLSSLQYSLLQEPR